MSGWPAPRLTLLLALADDELIIGHRHAEWTGWAPHLEEDLAFSSIAQDEMAHARLLYGLAADAADRPRRGRPGVRPRAGRVPQRRFSASGPTATGGTRIARQYLYDTADAVRLEALPASSWPDLADLVRLMQLEEAYHLDHARTWFDRLAGGPVTGRQQLADGLSAARRRGVGPVRAAARRGRRWWPTASSPGRARTLLEAWLGALGAELEAVSLDFVLERHAPGVGEMVPTASGEIEEARGVRRSGHRPTRRPVGARGRVRRRRRAGTDATRRTSHRCGRR